jgi:hypothetical protein
VTDDTSAIIDAANNSGSPVILIPSNTKFNHATLLASLPTNVVCIDFSAINNFDSAGETTKNVGILSSDEAVNDTHWGVASGHHPIIALNNYGTSGSSSASARRSSITWNAGKLNGTGTSKDGFRSAAIQQFSKEVGADFWVWQIRSLAPWLAIDAEYERWEEGLAVSTGDYMVYDQHYVATSSGTTGSTPPTHLSGTVSDGGVDWAFVDYADRTIVSVDQHGRLKLNGGVEETDLLSIRQSSSDPSATANFRIKARGTSRNVAIRFVPTKSDGNDASCPFLLGQDAVGLRVMKSTGSSDICRFDDEGTILTIKEERAFASVASDADVTPGVNGIATLYLSNTEATSITDLDGEEDGQRVTLIATNANTTLVHSSAFKLGGSADLAMGAYDAVTLEKAPSSVGDFWIEVSRSVK